jgi:flagellar motility protein MotE (MotC chaperone)
MSRLLVFADLGQIVIRVRSTARVTLAAGLGLLVLATAPQAAFGTVNLVQNAGAEDGPSGGGNITAVPSWNTTSLFSVNNYGNGDGPTGAVGQQIAGASNYFWGGPNNAVSTATQTIDVSSYYSAIATGRAPLIFGVFLGRKQGQRDHMDVKLDALDAVGTGHASISAFGGSANSPATTTSLSPIAGSVTIPKGTRTLRLTMTATRLDGNNNDAYADNLVVIVGDPSPVTITTIDRALALKMLVAMPAATAADVLGKLSPKVALKILSFGPVDGAKIVGQLSPKVALKILSFGPVDGAKILARLSPKVALKILSFGPVDGARIVAQLSPKVALKILSFGPVDGAKILARLPLNVGLKILRLASPATKATLVNKLSKSKAAPYRRKLSI